MINSGMICIKSLSFLDFFQIKLIQINKSSLREFITYL